MEGRIVRNIIKKMITKKKTISQKKSHQTQNMVNW